MTLPTIRMLFCRDGWELLPPQERCSSPRRIAPRRAQARRLFESTTALYVLVVNRGDSTVRYRPESDTIMIVPSTGGRWGKSALVRLGPGVGYKDGMSVQADGQISGATELANKFKRAIKLKARIRKYAADYVRALVAGKVAQPGAGDCWRCQGLGEATRDIAHLKAHMSERYYVPSLLFLALKRFPASPAVMHAIDCYMNKDASAVWAPDLVQEQIQKSLRRYMGKQFGLEVR